MILVSGSADTTARVWNVDDGTCLRVIRTHQSSVTVVGIWHDMLATGGADGEITVWDLQQAELPRRERLGLWEVKARNKKIAVERAKEEKKRKKRKAAAEARLQKQREADRKWQAKQARRRWKDGLALDQDSGSESSEGDVEPEPASDTTSDSDASQWTSDGEKDDDDKPKTKMKRHPLMFWRKVAVEDAEEVDPQARKKQRPGWFRSLFAPPDDSSDDSDREIVPTAKDEGNAPAAEVSKAPVKKEVSEGKMEEKKQHWPGTGLPDPKEKLSNDGKGFFNYEVNIKAIVRARRKVRPGRPVALSER